MDSSDLTRASVATAWTSIVFPTGPTVPYPDDVTDHGRWQEKLHKSDTPVIKPLDRRYAGHDVGDLMYIATPADLDQRIRRLPSGTLLTTAEFRAQVAISVGADFVCPMSTGMFLRIVTEAALEDLATGTSVDVITPFWRVIEPSSALANKISCGPDFIEREREREAR